MIQDVYQKSETQFPRQQCFQYIYVKFQVWVVNNKKDIYFQKIKLYFHILYTIRKAS